MSLTIADLLAQLRQQIPPAEVRLLLGQVLGQSAAWLEAHRDDRLTAADAGEMSALAGRRAAGEPMAYLVGKREFYGRAFVVTPDVLIPRPETELLIDIALQKVGTGETVKMVSPLSSAVPARKATVCPHSTTPHILDLGTGSGCVAITLALQLPQARVMAADLSFTALQVACGNAERLGAAVEFVESDWFTKLPQQHFDLIVANPPYVAAGDPHLLAGDLRYEPISALTDHADGLAALRHIIATAPAWLKPGGWLLLEHGYDQAAAVAALLQTAGLRHIEQHPDLAGIVRCSGAKMPDHYTQL